MPNEAFKVNSLFDAEIRVVDANNLLEDVRILRVHVVLNHDAVGVLRFVVKAQILDVGVQLNVNHVCVFVTPSVDIEVPVCRIEVPDLVDIIVYVGKVSNIEVLLDASRVELLDFVANREVLAIVIVATIAILQFKYRASFVHSFVQNLDLKAIFRLCLEQFV